jgi:hypothetical protein
MISMKYFFASDTVASLYYWGLIPVMVWLLPSGSSCSEHLVVPPWMKVVISSSQQFLLPKSDGDPQI